MPTLPIFVKYTFEEHLLSLGIKEFAALDGDLGDCVDESQGHEGDEKTD
jgi:hypothetical protein